MVGTWTTRRASEWDAACRPVGRVRERRASTAPMIAMMDRPVGSVHTTLR
jgi:hypothetical protein